jgi:hypothetical protein
MTKEDFLKALEAIGEKYDDDTWIDYDIVPSLAITLFEAFPEVNRNEILDALKDLRPSWWDADRTAQVKLHFSSRTVVKVVTDEGIRYWNCEWDELEIDPKHSSRFEDKDHVAEWFNKNHKENAIAKTGLPFELLEVPYPAWKEFGEHDAD